MRRIQLAVAFLAVVLSALLAVAADSKPVLVYVDGTQAPIGLLHAHFVFPSMPGPRIIGYPKWIPGEHAPTGPISQVIRLTFSAAGKQLTWQRDENEPFAFHVEIPQGEHELEADLDFGCERVGHHRTDLACGRELRPRQARGSGSTTMPAERRDAAISLPRAEPMRDPRCRLTGLRWKRDCATAG